jgi:hypothetical protein
VARLKQGASAGASSAAAASDPTQISATIRERICRVRNSILALASAFIGIYTATIMDVYDESITLGLPAKDMLNPDVLQTVTQSARERAK